MDRDSVAWRLGLVFVACASISLPLYALGSMPDDPESEPIAAHGRLNRVILDERGYQCVIDHYVYHICPSAYMRLKGHEGETVTLYEHELERA